MTEKRVFENEIVMRTEDAINVATMLASHVPINDMFVWAVGDGTTEILFTTAPVNPDWYAAFMKSLGYDAYKDLPT